MALMRSTCLIAAAGSWKGLLLVSTPASLPRASVMEPDWMLWVLQMVAKATKKRACHWKTSIFVGEEVLELTSVDGIFDTKECDATHRAVRRWLARSGHQCGHKKNVVVAGRVAKERDNKYLLTHFGNRGKPSAEHLREVYLDESYIHVHYNRNQESTYDPNDDQDVTFGKAPRKGRR